MLVTWKNGTANYATWRGSGWPVIGDSPQLYGMKMSLTLVRVHHKLPPAGND